MESSLWKQNNKLKNEFTKHQPIENSKGLLKPELAASNEGEKSKKLTIRKQILLKLIEVYRRDLPFKTKHFFNLIGCKIEE